jgi:predicted Zn-dependent peptidase
MEDLSAASLDDVEAFFRTYYTPDNAVLSVAGDFEADEARTLINEYFGRIPRGSGKPPLPPMDLPAHFGKTLREVVEDDVNLARLYVAFRSPVFGSDQYYTASVCGAVLGMRRGSRLYRSLVREKQVAADASAFTFDLAKGSDLLIVDVTALPETTPEQLEEAVESEIDLIVREGVSQDEVDRAVALIETDMMTSLQSASDRADRLSMFATLLGDAGLINEQAAKYRSVTAKMVSAFAADRLTSHNRAKLLYIPRAADVDDVKMDLAEAATS